MTTEQKNYICDGRTYILKNDTIGLPVDLSDLPESIVAEGITLLRKSNFHISLICIGQLVTRHSIAIQNFQQLVVDEFCKFTAQNDISFVRFRSEYRLATLNERRALIILCDVTNLDRFFAHINNTFGLTLETQPTHLTLFTLQQDKGIFLIDQADIVTRTKFIADPGLNIKISE
jgi:hypothetical protein